MLYSRTEEDCENKWLPGQRTIFCRFFLRFWQWKQKLKNKIGFKKDENGLFFEISLENRQIWINYYEYFCLLALLVWYSNNNSGNCWRAERGSRHLVLCQRTWYISLLRDQRPSERKNDIALSVAFCLPGFSTHGLINRGSFFCFYYTDFCSLKSVLCYELYHGNIRTRDGIW